MRNLVYLIFRYSAFLAFVTLEIICFALIVNFNKSQGEIWAHSSNLLVGRLNSTMQGVEDFFLLNQRNDSLQIENAKLLQTILNYRMDSGDNSFQEYEKLSADSTVSYRLIPARVSGKTVHLRNNYLTLSKGRRDGLREGMGVIIEKGVVGIIKSVSENYATVLMILHSQSRISAKVLNKEFHGNMIWESSDPREMNLKDVPKHASIARGDTIVTSGYSISFPPLIPIGKISRLEVEEGNNSYDIEVKLDYDLSSTAQVYVVAFQEMTEKKSLEDTNDE